MSAKFKILSILCGLFMAVIVTITTVSYFNFKTATTTAIEDKLTNYSVLVSEAVEQKVQRYFDGLDVMATNLAIDENGNFDIPKAQEQFKDLANSLGLLAAYAATADGEIVNAGGIVKKFNAVEKNREWHTRIFGGEDRIVTKPYKSGKGINVMALAVPVYRGGKLVATLSGNIEVNAITAFVNQLTEHNQMFVAREDGFILASYMPEQIGLNLYEERPSYEEYKNRPGTEHYYLLNDQSYFVVNAINPENGWSVWSWETEAKIHSSSDDNLVQVSILAFVLIAGSMAITYFLIIKLMYVPLGGEPEVINKLVRNIANGDLTLSPKNAIAKTGIYGSTVDMAEQLKNIILEINNASTDLNTAVTSISNASSEVTVNSQNQMEKIEMASTAINEMSVTSEEVTRNAVQASESAQQANEYSEHGINVVSEMNGNIVTLVDGIKEVVEVSTQLETETQNIGMILDTINGISEQTNLLALNAAIEAARAGEHGRGFAVVADEVRNLASLTKSSTIEIQDMIVRLQSEAQRSVSLMNRNVEDANNTAMKSDEANDALVAIKSSVQEILDVNNLIATAAEEQTAVSAEINNNVNEINDNAKIAYQSAKLNAQNTEDISEISQKLSASVDSFKV